MPFRRRRNIRSYVKVGIVVIVVLFFFLLIQLMGQIDNTNVSKRGDHNNREQENKQQEGVDRWNRPNYLREKVEANKRYNLGITDRDPSMMQTELKRTMLSMDRLVHLDLKGSPPKLTYLREFIPYAKSVGATGVILEYEDFFPYANDLEAISNQNHYTRAELKQLFDLLKENKMKVIPLIQTYGHLEFVLKLKQYSHLRESSKHFQVISPCLNDTYEKLIFRMIDQILETHPEDLEYIHIGCDEVYHVNVNAACKSMEQLETVQDFFI